VGSFSNFWHFSGPAANGRATPAILLRNDFRSVILPPEQRGAIASNFTPGEACEE
jgi:hypothetical protein